MKQLTSLLLGFILIFPGWIPSHFGVGSLPVKSSIESHKLAPYRASTSTQQINTEDLIKALVTAHTLRLFGNPINLAERGVQLAGLAQILESRGIQVGEPTLQSSNEVILTFSIPKKKGAKKIKYKGKYFGEGRTTVRSLSRRNFIWAGAVATVSLFLAACQKSEGPKPFPPAPSVTQVPTLVAVNNPDQDIEIELIVRSNGHTQGFNGTPARFRIAIFDQNGNPFPDPNNQGQPLQFYPLVSIPNGQESITIKLPLGTAPGNYFVEVRNASGDPTQQTLADSPPSQRIQFTVALDSILNPPAFSSQPQSADGGPNLSFNVTLIDPQATALAGTLIPLLSNGQPDPNQQPVSVNVIASDGQPDFNGTEEFFITVPDSMLSSVPASFRLELSTLGASGNNPAGPVSSQQFSVQQRAPFSGSPNISLAETLQGTNTAHLILNPSRPEITTFRVRYVDPVSQQNVDLFFTAGRDAQGNAMQTEVYFSLPAIGSYNLEAIDFAPNRMESTADNASVQVNQMGSALNAVTITTQPLNPNGDRRVHFIYDTGSQLFNTDSASATLRTGTGALIASGLGVITTNGVFNPQGVNDAFVDLPNSVPLNVPLVLEIFIGGQNIVPSPPTTTNTFQVTTLTPLQPAPTLVATVLNNGSGQSTNNIRLDLTPNPNNQNITIYEISYFDASTGAQIGQTEYRSIQTDAGGNPIAGTEFVGVPTNIPGSYRIEVVTSGPDTQLSPIASATVNFSVIGSVLAAPLINQQPTNPNGDLFVAFQMDSNNPTFPIQAGRARVFRVNNPTITHDLQVLAENGTFTNSGTQIVYIRIPANSAVLERDAGGNLLPTNLQFDLFVGGTGLPDSPSATSAQFIVNTETSSNPAPGINVTALQNTNTLQVDFVPNTNDPLVTLYHVEAVLGGNVVAEAFIPVTRDAGGNIINSTDFILVPQTGTYELRVTTLGPDVQNSPAAVQNNIIVSTLGTALNNVIINQQPANNNNPNVSFQFDPNNTAVPTQAVFVEVVRPAQGGNPIARQFVSNVGFTNPGGAYLPTANNQAFTTVPNSLFLRDAGGNALPTDFFLNLQVGGTGIVPSNPVATAQFTLSSDQSPIAAAPTVTPVTPPGGQFFTDFTIDVTPNTNLTTVTNYHIIIRQNGAIISQTFPSVAKDASGIPIPSRINLNVSALGTYDIEVNAFGPTVFNGPSGTAQVNVTQAGNPFIAPTTTGPILNADGDNTLTAQLDLASLSFADKVVLRVTPQGQAPLPLIGVPVSSIRPNGELDFSVGGITGNLTVEIALDHSTINLDPSILAFTAPQATSITTAGTLFNTPTNLSVQNNAAGPNVIDVIFNPNNPIINPFYGDSNVAIIRVDVPGRQPTFFFPLLNTGVAQGGGNLLFTVTLPPGGNNFTVDVFAAVGHLRQTDSALAGPVQTNVTIAMLQRPFRPVNSVLLSQSGSSRRTALGAAFAPLIGFFALSEVLTDEKVLNEGVLVTKEEVPTSNNSSSQGNRLAEWFKSKLKWTGFFGVSAFLLASLPDVALGKDKMPFLFLAESLSSDLLFLLIMLAVILPIFLYVFFSEKNKNWANHELNKDRPDEGFSDKTKDTKMVKRPRSSSGRNATLRSSSSGRNPVIRSSSSRIPNGSKADNTPTTPAKRYPDAPENLVKVEVSI